MADFYGCELRPAGEGRSGGTLPDDILAVIDAWRPTPIPFPLVRLGGSVDGAYLVPDDLDGVVACFSPGVADRKSFEDDLAERGIRSHMADFSADPSKLRTPLIDGMQTFDRKWLDIDGSEDSVRLSDWVDQYEPGRDDLILQMDIEGAEYRNLLSTPRSVLARFRIIIIEIHDLHRLADDSVRSDVFEPLLEHLSDFAAVHAHANNCCGDWAVPASDVRLPKILELTLIRKDRLSTEGEAESYLALAPHPLDITNVPGRPPLHLDPYWLGGQRPLESQLIILEEQAAAAAELAESLEAALTTSRLASNEAHARQRTPLAIQRFGLRDLAAGKPYALSSGFGSSSLTGRVPGSNAAARLPFFFHTGIGVGESITIDLGSRQKLHWLVLENRQDGWQDRAEFLFYVIHDEPEPAFAQGRPAYCPSGFFARHPSPSWTSLGGKRGRYVTLYAPARTALHLASVEVLGRRLRPPLRTLLRTAERRLGRRRRAGRAA